MSQSFWNRQQNCPAVYIASVNLNNELRTSYGISWAIKDVRNSSGSVIGNEIRAELTAFKMIIESANVWSLPQLVIITKTSAIDNELDRWETFKAEKKGNQKFANADILMAIDTLLNEATQRNYFLAENNDENPKAYFAALHLATSDAHKRENCQPMSTVAIYGACAQEGQANSKASFGVFWGDGDMRNEEGPVDGRQTHHRAGLYALRAALKRAIRERIGRLRILTRLNVIKLVVQSLKTPDTVTVGKTVGELIAECKTLASRLDEVFCEFIKPEIENEMLTKAKELAKYVVAVRSARVQEPLDLSLLDVSDEDDRIFPVTVRDVTSYPPTFQRKYKPFKKVFNAV